MKRSEIKSVITETFEMEYFSFGSGARPFLIIPGISMKPVMLSADAIAAGFQAFADRYTVYVFDRKKNIRTGYSVEDMAEDTAQAMKAIGIRDADIFGASQGGMIAQCIALRYPELVHALFLGSTMSRPSPLCRDVMQEWLTLSAGDDVRRLNHAVNARIYSEDYYGTYRSIFEAMEGDGTPEEMARFHVLVQACLDFDIYDRLPELDCPVFVAGSHSDRVLSGASSVELAEKLNCPLYMYDGYSHAVYDEAPDYRTRILDALSF